MSSPTNRQGAVRKRQQIKESSRMMFISVAGMSVVVGFALVVSWFLWQQLLFRYDIVAQKNDTVQTLRENNQAVVQLREEIGLLEGNTALNESKANRSDKALQVILDALPSDANSLALGASLQDVLADGIKGLSVESLTVEPSAYEQQDEALVSGEQLEGQINFRMVVTSSNINAHRQLLERFERSIRVIDIDRLRLEKGQDTYTLTIEAHGYYQPARQVELVDKVVNGS